MSALNQTMTQPDEDGIGNWHPASRPDTEADPQSDTEELQPQQDALRTEVDSAKRNQAVDVPKLGDAVGTEQASATPIGEEKKEDLSTERNEVVEHSQQGDKDFQSASHMVSWAPPQDDVTNFEDPSLSSDEDEERLDPAWGIKRTSSTQILQNITRSTSFPSFDDTTEDTKAAQNMSLPHSQAEDIVHRMDSGKALGARLEEADQPDGTSNSAHDDWARSANDFAEGTPSHSVEPQFAIHTETRFEEGLPLISAGSGADIGQTQLNQGDERPEAASFATSEDDDSFFDNKAAQFHRPLNRKTTADVLDHLGSHPDDPADSLTERQSREVSADEVAINSEFRAAMDMITAREEKLKKTNDDPWAAALDDDEFLIEDDDDLLPESGPGSPSSFNALLKGDTEKAEEIPLPLHEETLVDRTPPLAIQEQRPELARHPSSNPYAPHQPSTSDLTQLLSTTYGNVGFNRPALTPMASFQHQLQQRPTLPQKTESFVDQKGGYKSPYDLPMEIAKPRKRQQTQAPVQNSKSMPPPPPRTSSMSSNQGLQSPMSPTFPSGQGTAVPLQSSRPTPRSATVTSPPKASSTPINSFFEELPIMSRPRPAAGQGRYSPQQVSSILPSQPLHPDPLQIQAQPSPSQPSADPYAQYQLRAPEKIDPYANVALQVPLAPANPVLNARYSPNATAAVNAARPSPSPRYSPAPPPQAAQSRYTASPATAAAAATAPPPPVRQYTPVLPSNTQVPPMVSAFQPRTSSPLAYMGRSVSEQTEQLPQSQQKPTQYDSSTLPSRYAPPQAQKAATPPPSTEMPANRRSQTQSPGRRGVPPSLQALLNGEFQRPGSVPGLTSPTKGLLVEIAPPSRPSIRQRGMTGSFNFIEPTDGQERDVLQRWKGAPIFNFGFGGALVTSFPKHIPRYAMNSAAPMIKPSAGQIHVRSAIDVIPVQEHITSFPGPLRSKSKKKDVLIWLNTRITTLEQEHLYHNGQVEFSDLHKRRDEKLLLWKIVQALVEHDGVLEGSVTVHKTVSTILSPGIYSLDDASATQYGAGDTTSGIYRPTGSSSYTVVVDTDAVESLRKHLLRGEREKAVWMAVDKRLWSHALLMASTLESTVWKQVVQEFVRQEVKLVGNNTESLAALYEIFAGNFDESIDELVPPSARAGLQMVSKIGSSGPTKNALDGLDHWRETLSLVLSNRTNNDFQALTALGKLLMGYGRVEAAHTCHLFARNPAQPALFGGDDDPYASVVLLGVDHHSQPTEFFQDEDAIMLTEIYEFAVMVLAGNPAASLPHLQVYKLQRASWMADNGRKAEAQAYCETITSLWKSSTKLSLYYNKTLLSEVEDLASRLGQVPIKSSSSWATTPSLEKVGNSLFSKLSNFVAGEDSDPELKGSGKDVNHEFGPFANITGTPSLSRTGSASEIYGGYPSTIPVPNTAAGSRYAPNGPSTARSSSELTRGRPSLDSQRSPLSTGQSPMPQPNPYEQSSFGQPSPFASQTSMYQPLLQSPPLNQFQATPPQSSYMPQATQEQLQRPYMPHQQGSYIPTPPLETIQSSYMPTPPLEPEHQPTLGGYAPPEQQAMPEFSQAVPSNGDERVVEAYSGYEPASGYVPYEPEPDSPELPARTSRKKSYVDDDDDFPRAQDNHALAHAAPAVTASEDDVLARKRANDATADAAFRAAAEADAAKGKQQQLKPKASGWFNIGVPSVPFLGSKKDVNSLGSKAGTKASEPKVHRVHLGESKMSLYYDDKLKKWVNPNDPESSKPKLAPAPPPARGPTPTGGPPRGMTASATMPNLSSNGPGMANGPSSRSGTPAQTLPGAGTPPAAGAVANLMSGPPSRPATGQGGGSDLDDLLGPGMGGGRRTVKGKKGGKSGRYIDIMGQNNGPSGKVD